MHRGLALLVLCTAIACDTAGPIGDGDSADVAGNRKPMFATSQSVTALLYANPGGKSERRRSDSEVAKLLSSELEPPFSQLALGDPLQPWTYLDKMSALGMYGPLGPYGPLGIVGPLGGSPFNADFFVSGLHSWSDWSAQLTKNGGPLSSQGPLGHLGPLNVEFWQDLPSLLESRIQSMPMPPGLDAKKLRDALRHTLGNDFVSHLVPGGVFGALGPVGVLGALGPLGPLGPLGAHGYRRSDDGDYVPDKGTLCRAVDGEREKPPCRQIEVEWEKGGEHRIYELVEHYDEAHAAEMTDNDTSFFVTGEIEGDEADAYSFSSRQGQWVTVVVVPETAKYFLTQALSILGQSALGTAICGGVPDLRRLFAVPEIACVQHVTALAGPPLIPIEYDHEGSFDDFDIELEVAIGSKRGKIASESAGWIDWIQVWVPEGAQLEATVSLASAWEPRVNLTDVLGLDVSNDARWGMLARTAAPTYRLFVVGATAQAETDPYRELSGPYLSTLKLR